jgi:GT2 family glycosyltransferase
VEVEINSISGKLQVRLRKDQGHDNHYTNSKEGGRKLGSGNSHMKSDVTIAITAYRSEKYVEACMKSIQRQTFRNFELVVVEDFPQDGTENLIEALCDERIRYFKSEKHLGIAAARNRCVGLARGDYLFFVDADCTASRNWIEEGLKTFREHSCVGVEGRIYYVSEGYEPTYSDYVRENILGGNFMTGNMAYKKDVVEKLGGFDERYTCLEDRDLALRALKLGTIPFNPKMVVYHRKATMKPMDYLAQAERVRNRVLLYKKLGEKPYSLWRITYPQNLLVILVPLLAFGSAFIHRYRTKQDFALLPFIYLRLVCERLLFWEMCARERVLLI